MRRAPSPRAAAPRADALPSAPPRPYDRRRELPRILPLWPHEVADESLEGRRLVLAKLRRALRAERRRGLAGHWAYDLSRHVELLRVYRAELASMTAAGRGEIGASRRPGPPP